MVSPCPARGYVAAAPSLAAAARPGWLSRPTVLLLDSLDGGDALPELVREILAKRREIKRPLLDSLDGGDVLPELVRVILAKRWGWIELPT